MGEIDPSQLRISDTEREQAVRMLGEHMSLGRLDVDEYGERSARATAAKIRGELIELFADLPEPRPKLGTAAAVPPPYQPAAAPPATGPARFEDQPLAQRVWKAMVPLSALIALVLFLTVFRMWFVFLLPAAVAIIGGAVWGDDWKQDRRDLHGRMRHRQLRRGWHD